VTAGDVRATGGAPPAAREKLGPPLPRLREVYVSNQPLRRMSRPATREPLPPRAVGRPELDYRGDARASLPIGSFGGQSLLRRSFVNRVWAAYFGVGLVEPVDNFSVANPPSNAPLLDALRPNDLRRAWLRPPPSGAPTILLSRNLPALRHPPMPRTPATAQTTRALRPPDARRVVVDVLNAAWLRREDFGPGHPARQPR